ncbi:phosphatase PAP2 family protein [Sphingomonas sp. OK281]|uniref:phosphatase PAP2 family protein n=1 Tax=Sphingomonas sp. OK281 TaxID=1881067 RepID=UPI0008E6835A|nr:phosphatase PAP2 family protein [Sphingomonas sp. OK281]SFO05722.1 PAP2 superfamily protein [Sphingomonas sp. OK281]
MRANIVSIARFEPSSRPILAEGAGAAYAAVAIAWIIALLGVAARHLTIAVDEFAMAAVIVGAPIGMGLCLRGRGLDRLGTIAQGCGLFMAGCLGMTLLTFVLGTADRPLVDPVLAAIDRTLVPTLDWPAAMLWLSHRASLMAAANWVYESIGWQPVLLIAILGQSGQEHRVWTFLTAWLVTLFVTCALFALFPGIGAYAYFGMAAADVPAMRDPTPWHQAALLAELRGGTLHHVGFVDLDGIVTFPSFHAAAAVILAWAAWSLRAIRWPAIVLNGAMLVSAVPIGGHYLIDIVAGCVVAALGLAITRRIAEPSSAGRTAYRPPSRRVSAATQLARSIVLPSGSRASR